MPRSPRRVVAGLMAVGSLIAASLVARPYAHGLAFVIRAADLRGTLRTVADLDAGPIREMPLTIPLPAGFLRARAYVPAGGIRRTALLVGGVHSGGYDEPRLVAFARQLAASGVSVVTPAIPDLSQFVITPALTDAIEQAAAWLARDATWAPDGRIGMMGISFSGGLSLVAAGRPSLRGRVAYVFSFGGHEDLPRVLRYLCTGVAGGARLPPHDYGLALVLLGVADRLVPPDQVAALREAVRRYLRASYMVRLDKANAGREFAVLGEVARTLPEPAATLLTYVITRDVVRLGESLLPHIADYGSDAALSVSRSPKPDAPVFLLHGSADTVIPAEESAHLAADLRGTPVRLLLTDLISHAEADQPAYPRDVLQLAAFWGDLLER